MRITKLLLLFICLAVGGSWSMSAQEYSLSFVVTDFETGLPLQDAQIAITPCNCGGITSRSGRFSIGLPANTYQISVSFIGYAEDIQTITLNKSTILKIALNEQQEQLSEVIVRAKTIAQNIESPQMGALQLNSRDLKKIPAAVGEYDVLRGMTLLAGVNNSGEISNGLSVRGGSLDQNLILFDYAPVFNPTHLFGLFSVFTPDMISSVDLYRANIPSRYGGRSSAVLDVKVKNPYVDKTKISGGIGIVSSRLTLETPIVKDKLMLTAGVRAGFTDFLLPLVSERLKDTKANFYDGTFKLLYLPTENDQLSFTGFYSKDFYQLDLISKVQDINAASNQYDFRTLNGTLNWTHTFKNEANLRTLLIASDYAPKTLFPEVNSRNKITFESSIQYLSFVSEYSHALSDKVDYYAGLQANQYQIEPGTLGPREYK